MKEKVLVETKSSSELNGLMMTGEQKGCDHACKRATFSHVGNTDTSQTSSLLLSVACCSSVRDSDCCSFSLSV